VHTAEGNKGRPPRQPALVGLGESRGWCEAGIVEYHDSRDFGSWQCAEEPQEVIGVLGSFRRENFEPR